MKKRDYLIVFLASVIFYAGLMAFQKSPGYMDADYYYANSVQLAMGKGFVEPFIWNFLNNPTKIPVPAHLYWMPLPSLISAGAMVLLGVSFVIARIPFLILTAALATLSMAICYSFSHNRTTAWVAAGFALFSGYYSIYWTLPETFSLTAVLGAGFLLLSGLVFQKKFTQPTVWLGLGIISGLIHLTRADGILWLGIGICVWLVVCFDKGKLSINPHAWMGLLILITGYLSITGWWYIRNVMVFGTPFQIGNSRTLWLTNYNETFNFPAAGLTFSHWLQSGARQIILSRLDALLQNLKTALAVQGGIYLLPFILFGMWRMRKDPRTWVGVSAWLILLGVMSFVFPFAGARGGFLHSGSALQVMFWSFAAIGVQGGVELGVKYRHWEMKRALRNFGIILVIASAMITMSLFLIRVVGTEPGKSLWQAPYESYFFAGKQLDQIDPQRNRIMVNNPPGFFLATHRECVVIPNGGITEAKNAAKTFRVKYLLLDENYVKELEKLYLQPGDQLGMKYLGEIKDFRLYEFEDY